MVDKYKKNKKEEDYNPKPNVIRLFSNRTYSGFQIKKVLGDGLLIQDLIEETNYFIKDHHSIKKLKSGQMIEAEIGKLKGDYIFLSNLKVYPEEMANFIRREKESIKEENEIDQLIDQAILFLETQRPEKTIKIINKILSKNKNNDLAWLIKGEAWMILGELGEAEKSFKECEKINPKNPNLFLNKANLNFIKNNFTVALRECNKGLKHKPKFFDLIIIKANILYQLGKKDYKIWIEKAKKINKQRTQEFMEKFWIHEKLNKQLDYIG
jgi:tetratricopeptide (TPR) repeat protein